MHALTGAALKRAARTGPAGSRRPMASVTRMLAAKPQVQPAAPKPAPTHNAAPAAATVRATPASEERLAAPEDRFIGMTGAQVRGGRGHGAGLAAGGAFGVLAAPRIPRIHMCDAAFSS